VIATVSIVVPVAHADEHLIEQLRALAAQSDVPSAEVIVAANREAAPIERAVRTVEWPEAWDVRVVDAADIVGPSHARNVGWRAASGAVVLFCDADDLVDPGWASAMTTTVLQSGICGGRLDHERLNSAALAARYRVCRDDLPTKFRHRRFAPSCSLGVRRDLLVAVGGFDEELRCGEDIDLCWRVQDHGVTIAFAREAVVAYRLRASPRAAFRQAVHYGADDALLFVRHRAAGASWTVRDSVREVLAAAVAIALCWRGLEARITAAARLGSVVGRMIGSARHRVLAM
jgi:GT2 family glycosyltransferase